MEKRQLMKNALPAGIVVFMRNVIFKQGKVRYTVTIHLFKIKKDTMTTVCSLAAFPFSLHVVCCCFLPADFYSQLFFYFFLPCFNLFSTNNHAYTILYYTILIELRYAYNPKDDEPELYKPTIDDWRTFLITGGEDELQDSEKKQPILDSIHCYDESDPEFIYGKDDWNDLFDYYVSTFKSSETKSTIQEEYDVTDTYSTSAFKGYPIVNHDNNNGMAFIQNMYEVRFDTDNHRRAVYATEDIPSGTQIWQPSTTVQFYPMVQYYRFLEQILVAGDNAMACDIVDWTYNTNDGKMLCIAFDDMSMMNGIDIDFSMMSGNDHSIEQTIMMSKVNIGWKPTKKEYNLYTYDFGCQDGGSLFATRDIKKGEGTFTII